MAIKGNEGFVELTMEKNNIAAIDELSKKMCELFDRGDFHEMSLLYAPECRIYPPGMGVVFGRKSAEELYSGFIEIGAKKLKFEVDESHISETHAVQLSRFKCLDGEGRTLDQGTNIQTLENFGDNWLIVEDFITSDQRSLEDEINELLDQYMHAYHVNDIALICNQMMTSQCRLCMPGLPTITGRKAIEEYYRYNLKGAGLHRIEVSLGPLRKIGNVVQMTDSTYKSYNVQDRLLRCGRNTVLFKKEDGKWKMDCSMCNLTL